MTDIVDDRLTDLEIRLAHHEKLVDDLSAVVAGQAAVLDRLTQQIRHLSDRLREAEENFPHAPRDDDKPPPHY